MVSALMDSPEIREFLDRISGLQGEAGDPRLKQILRRVVSDLFATIEDFDVSQDEFWSMINFMIAGAPEFGLWAAGLGFEHFLDVRLDRADRAKGVEGGTPRTIEGPLYVAGAPLSEGEARLDDGTEAGDTLIVHGRVVDSAGASIAGATVDVWHANALGNYSHFDPSQTPFNLRRRVLTGTDGCYRFRSIIPAGYGVPAGGTTERLLQAVGRHGRRPAHIHFFISAPGHRHLTTQLNIAGDPYLHDDFAYATRDGLIADAVRHDDPEAIRAAGLNAPYAEVAFDFVLLPASRPEDALPSRRIRAAADA